MESGRVFASLSYYIIGSRFEAAGVSRGELVYPAVGDADIRGLPSFTEGLSGILLIHRSLGPTV
jgi:hypothetical protein